MAAGENLTLDSTAHATKGNVLLAPSGGLVGVGTATPGARLDVAGDARLRPMTAPVPVGPGHMYFDGAGRLMVSLDGIEFKELLTSAPGGSGITGAGTAGRLARFDSGSSVADSIVYDNGASIGIGTASPSERLDVAGGNIRTDSQFISTVGTGTAPLVIGSNTHVVNLNADLLDGLDSGDFASATHDHDAADTTSGVFDIARLPVGTVAGTVAEGDHDHNADYAAIVHGHDAADVTSGVMDVARLPVGTGAGEVAAGDHPHTLAGDVTGDLGAAVVEALQGRPVADTAPGAGQVLAWDGLAWSPAADVNSGGTVTQIDTGAGLTGGPVTDTGTIAVDFAGTGAADTVARSDHEHDTDYAEITHAATHMPGGTDELAWTTIHGEGELVSRPSADATNAGLLYLATDVDGGTLFRSDGATWTQVAKGVTALPEAHEHDAADTTSGVFDIARLPVGVGTGEVAAGDHPHTLAGDVTGDIGAAVVEALQGRPVADTAPGAGQVLAWDGLAWSPAADVNSGGTVTQIDTGAGLTGGPITGSGTVTVDFAGTGAADTVARSDHDHDSSYVNLTGDTMTGELMLSMSAPSLILRETDQTLPSGLWRARLEDDAFSIEKNTAAGGGFTTVFSPFVIAPTGTTELHALRLPTGATDGHVLTSDASGNATWAANPGATGWQLGGNAGTTAGTNFVGTTDAQPLELKVNNARVIRFEPHAEMTSWSPNVLTGHHANWRTVDVYGATVGGGGDSGMPNRVTDHFGTVGGGTGNQAGNNDASAGNKMYATVGGGLANTASGTLSTVGGGEANTASDDHTFVGGGYTNSASAFAATVAGGNMNAASGWASAVLGGENNTASGMYSFAAGMRAKANHDGTFVWADSTGTDHASTAANQFLVRAGGGVGINTTDTSQGALTVAGRTVTQELRVMTGATDGHVLTSDAAGNATWAANPGATGWQLGGNAGTTAGTNFMGTTDNQALELRVNSSRAVRIEPDASGRHNFIAGHAENAVTGGAVAATISGGGMAGGANTVSADFGTVGGGLQNTSSGVFSTVAGASSNVASGAYSFVGGAYNQAGGYAATALNMENSAAGDYSLAAGYRAKAVNNGAFVWADTTAHDFSSFTDNEFAARATGGFRFVTGVDAGGAPTDGIGISSLGQILHGIGNYEIAIERKDSEQSMPVTALAVSARSTGGGGMIGYGSSIGFNADNGSNTPVRAAEIGSRWFNSTAGNETADFSIATLSGGWVTERLRVTHDGKLSVGSGFISKDVSLDGTQPRELGPERSIAGWGHDFTVSAGGAHPMFDLPGGDLVLKSGISTGDQGSAIRFMTATPGTSGDADRYPDEKMIIDKNGNVGIGVGSPQAMLDVAGTTRTSSLQMTTGATDGHVLTSDAAGNATWAANPGATGWQLGGNAGTTAARTSWGQLTTRRSSYASTHPGR